jgi:hypothetical protein
MEFDILPGQRAVKGYSRKLVRTLKYDFYVFDKKKVVNKNFSKNLSKNRSKKSGPKICSKICPKVCTKGNLEIRFI